MRLLPWKTVVLMTILATLSACSSSQTKEEAEGEVPPAADAGTDAVPQPSTETPASSSIDPVPDSTPTPSPTTTPLEETSPAPASTTLDTSASSSNLNSSESVETEDYTVQQGDTLMKIAFETYGDVYKWKEILESNKDKITDPNAISAGVILKIQKPASAVTIERNGEKYLIKKGDTLGKISDALYGTPSKWRKIWENNKQLIKDPNKIFAGFYLYYIADHESKEDTSSSAEQSDSNSGAKNTAAPEQSTPQPAAKLVTPGTSQSQPAANSGQLTMPVFPSDQAKQGESK